MPILKRYISTSKLTIQVEKDGEFVNIPFSGRNVSTGGYYFETMDEDLQVRIETLPSFKTYFNVEAGQKVEKGYKPTTPQPEFKKAKKEPENKETKEEVVVNQLLLDAVIKHWPEATVENYIEKAVELIDGIEIKVEETTKNPETPGDKSEETDNGDNKPTSDNSPTTEKPETKTELPVVEKKNLASAKKWLSELGETCAPNTTKLIAEEKAKAKGYQLVWNPELEE